MCIIDSTKAIRGLAVRFRQPAITSAWQVRHFVEHGQHFQLVDHISTQEVQGPDLPRQDLCLLTCSECFDM